MKNVTRFEDLMQTYIEDLHRFWNIDFPLGRKLWRHVAKGPKGLLEEGHYKVFLALSFDVPDLIADGKIEVVS